MEKKRRILVVDNDRFECISCRAMLRGVEFDVLFCEDADAAVERLWKEDFELVITNIRLPNKYTGLTLVQEMKFMRPKTDIVVMADQPSIWDAREALRIGASCYAERPFTPECLRIIARRSFDRKGWIVRKTRIDQFRDHIVPSPGTDNPLLYYKRGAWARQLEGCLWEVGCDMRYWSGPGRNGNGASSPHLDGDLRKAGCDLLPHDPSLSITLHEGLSAMAAGEPCAQVRSGAGAVHALAAPLTGVVEEINEEAPDILSSGEPGDRGPDWMLWLARIRTKGWECGTAEDVKEGRMIGTYEHIGQGDLPVAL